MIEEIVKVARNYRVTIPASIRAKARINVGDTIKIIYDEREEVIKIIPLRKKG